MVKETKAYLKSFGYHDHDAHLWYPLTRPFNKIMVRRKQGGKKPSPPVCCALTFIQIAGPLVFAVFSFIPLLALFFAHTPKPNVSSISTILKAINLCFASTVISITTVLNFSLAASLAILLGIPLSISSGSGPLPVKVARYAGYTVLALGWLLCGDEVQKAIWDWEILSVWFAPFVCVVYVPLLLQAGLVCLLPL